MAGRAIGVRAGVASTITTYTTKGPIEILRKYSEAGQHSLGPIVTTWARCTFSGLDDWAKQLKLQHTLGTTILVDRHPITSN